MLEFYPMDAETPLSNTLFPRPFAVVLPAWLSALEPSSSIVGKNIVTEINGWTSPTNIRCRLDTSSYAWVLSLEITDVNCDTEDRIVTFWQGLLHGAVLLKQLKPLSLMTWMAGSPHDLTPVPKLPPNVHEILA